MNNSPYTFTADIPLGSTSRQVWVSGFCDDMAHFMRHKYERGQIEHKGDLGEVPLPKLVDHGIEEAVDQLMYLGELKRRVIAGAGFAVIDRSSLSRLLTLVEDLKTQSEMIGGQGPHYHNGVINAYKQGVAALGDFMERPEKVLVEPRLLEGLTAYVRTFGVLMVPTLTLEGEKEMTQLITESEVILGHVVEAPVTVGKYLKTNESEK